MKFKPLGNRILVKRSEVRISRGGILLPDSAQEKPKQGEVVATGPGKIDDEGRLIAPGVIIGDNVLFTSYAGTEVHDVDDDENEYLIMTEDDLLAVLVEEE